MSMFSSVLADQHVRGAWKIGQADHPEFRVSIGVPVLERGCGGHDELRRHDTIRSRYVRGTPPPPLAYLKARGLASSFTNPLTHTHPTTTPKPNQTSQP